MTQQIANSHSSIIHDAQLDFYGKYLATCSSDRLVKIYEIEGTQQTHIQDLQGHAGPVWQVCWAHPKFGTLLASCSYDRRVIVWKREGDGSWQSIYESSKQLHTLSINAIAFAPYELGLCLVCGSSDGTISLCEWNDELNTFDESKLQASSTEIGAASASSSVSVTDDEKTTRAHKVGINAVSWAPATFLQGDALSTLSSAAPVASKKFVSGGCDKLVKVWQYDTTSQQWRCEAVLKGHRGWVRDVAWSPNVGVNQHQIASCSEDGSVLIWTQTFSDSDENPPFEKTTLPLPNNGPVWRVSWSTTGNILAVSSGENSVSLWKETLDGKWKCISGDVLKQEQQQQKDQQQKEQEQNIGQQEQQATEQQDQEQQATSGEQQPSSSDQQQQQQQSSSSDQQLAQTTNDDAPTTDDKTTTIVGDKTAPLVNNETDLGANNTDNLEFFN
mmetsp:Transcript_9245/g.13982  ORF Transcript_9245/g.13982 Transcript_9245/m.13982 type:complete len:444 (+) Transcript_9245:29-1360(+)